MNILGTPHTARRRNMVDDKIRARTPYYFYYWFSSVQRTRAHFRIIILLASNSRTVSKWRAVTVCAAEMEMRNTLMLIPQDLEISARTLPATIRLGHVTSVLVYPRTRPLVLSRHTNFNCLCCLIVISVQFKSN